MGFAQQLSHKEHQCVISLPSLDGPTLLSDHSGLRLISHAETRNDSSLFQDGSPADIIHAWTPRDPVRQVVIKLLHQHTSRLIVHMEDNEEYITAHSSDLTFQQLQQLPDYQLNDIIKPHYMHPRRGPALLEMADAISIITPSLSRFVPPGTPSAVIHPIIDSALFRPHNPPESLRADLSLSPEDRIITYTGGVHPINRSDIIGLYEMTSLINAGGTPCKLIHTGPGSCQLASQLPREKAAHVKAMGMVDRNQIPQLLALADVLVQPGPIDDYNTYRLPSKIPQFLSMGKPVILPATNIGLALKDRQQAVVLNDTSPQSFANACLEVFNSPQLAARLANGAHQFATQAFNIDTNASTLEDLYLSIMNAPEIPLSSSLLHTDHTEMVALTLKMQSLITNNSPDIISRLCTSIQRNQAVAEDDLQHLSRIARRLPDITASYDAIRNSLIWRASRPLRQLLDFVTRR